MSNIKYEKKAEEYVLYMSGRVDSNNAANVEEQIKAVPDLSGYDAVILDVENLEYISSAGLRIILKLRKDHKDLKIINASTEIYEILDMTGFAEMIPVQKAYRKLSVDGCEVIGQGANGKVYRLDADTIIKVYIDGDSLEDIKKERELARRAFVLGVPTAIPYDVVKVGDSYGSVFELLNAKSFAKILAEEPKRIDEIAGMYVDLLKKIHSTDVSNCDINDIKAEALGYVEKISGCIPEDARQKLHKLISEIPQNYHMIHGDYHIKNVMMQNGEALLIDMDTLSHGDPVFEFAFIYNAYIGFTALDHSITQSFFGIPYDLGVELWKKTIKLYFGTNDEKFLKSVENKASVIAYLKQIKRIVAKGLDKTDAGRKSFDFYKSELVRLLGEVDSLAM